MYIFLDILFTMIIIGVTYFLFVRFGIVAAGLFIVIIEMREIMISLRDINRHVKGIDKTLLDYVIKNHKQGE